jgi:exosortase
VKTTWKKKPWWAAWAVGLAGAAVFQFFGNATRGYIDTGSVFWWWGYQWFDVRSQAEHGPLMVGLAAWVWWRNLGKDQGPRAKDHGSAAAEEVGALWPAVVAMVLGLGLHVLGFAAQQTRISVVGLLVFAWGVVRLGGGRRWGEAAAFPLALLVFAIPLAAIDEVGLPLRLRVVEAGEALSRAMGIAVVRNGTQLVAPDGRFNYDVAAPCSGVNSLVALAALSLLIGYLNFRGWSRRMLVLGPCLPLVYIGNVARITSIVVAAQWGGPRWGEMMHAVMGYGVFVIVLGGVLATAVAVRRWWPERAAKRAAEKCHVLRDTLVGDAGWKVAAAVIALSVGAMFFLHGLANRPVAGEPGVMLAADGKNPAELPSFLGTEWIGRRAEVSAVEREILPADTGFARKNYVAVTNPTQQVFLSVVLSGRDRSSIHRPELCLVGQGWTVEATKGVRWSLPGRGGERREFPATLLRVRREIATPRGRTIVTQWVAYWFVGGDEVVATHAGRMLRDGWNRVAHGRADRWAYVLAQTDGADGEAAALARMQTVLDGALPAVQQVAGGAK